MDFGVSHYPDAGWAPQTSELVRAKNGSYSPQKLASTGFVETLQQLIDDLPEQIALLDERCDILAVNTAWKDAVEEHGYLDVLPGHSYRAFCAARAREGYEPAIEAVAALDDIASGRRSFWQLFYNGRERWKGREYQICARRMMVEGRCLISITRFDLTEIIELRRAKDDFAATLIAGQETERQRIVRELHDSTSQQLTAIGLIMGRLKDQSSGPEALHLIEEMQELLQEAHQDIRSISYLAHPPSLEKLGLAGAVRSLVEGFARRAGWGATFEIHGESLPVGETAQGAVYRVAQEALSNVHRHARASRIRVQLLYRRSSVHLVVADDGVGIPTDGLDGTANSGVGLASMRSRLSEIGGRLSIRRLSPGTAIIASLF